MKEILERLLRNAKDDPSLQGRDLTYTEKGIPVLWDLPFYGNKEEVEAAISFLEREEVLAALRKGLLLPETQVFIWVSQDGELDYGLVQGDYFITLWVPSVWEKVKNLPLAQQKIVAAEEVYRLAHEKFHRERAWKEETLRDLINPWTPLTKEERKERLEYLLQNLHPSWKNLRDKVEVLLTVA